jgi:uncharacterized protein YjlB
VAPEPEQLRFPRGDRIPNHPRLPVLAYRGVPAAAEGAAACEQLFTANGWGGTWRDGVFDFHHFHSTSHEALGVVGGSAVLALGGPQGDEVEVAAGDVLVLPAGTGHKRVSASEDFQVVGAYPPGQEDYDLRRGDPAELEEALATIERVAAPTSDPVGGEDGALLDAWADRDG